MDDEDGPRQSLRFVFKDEYNLLLASSGAEAMHLARQHPVDVAVVDIRMRGMSGIELLAGLKKLDETIEVIILTAYETIETARQALRLEACDYLNKPFDLATVRAAVSRAVQKKSLSEHVLSCARQLHDLQDQVENQRLREEIIKNRGEIYGSVLHDINGPLTVISGFISMINLQLGSLKSLDPRSTLEFRQRLQAVNRYVGSCVSITQRYLSFLRQGPGTVDAVSVNQTLQDVGELLHSHPNANNNQLIILPMSADQQVRANGTDVIQILLNLAVNGLQCTPAAHTVEISAAAPCDLPLDLTLFTEGPQDRFLRHEDFDGHPPLVALQVRDTGPGMPPDVVAKLFRTYFTTKPAPQGTGLGLSIVKRLVLLSRGALGLHTEPGVGTIFTIYLPGGLPAPAATAGE